MLSWSEMRHFPLRRKFSSNKVPQPRKTIPGKIDVFAEIAFATLLVTASPYLIGKYYFVGFIVLCLLVILLLETLKSYGVINKIRNKMPTIRKAKRKISTRRSYIEFDVNSNKLSAFGKETLLKQHPGMTLKHRKTASLSFSNSWKSKTTKVIVETEIWN